MKTKLFLIGLLVLLSFRAYAFDYTVFELNAGSGLQGKIDIQTGVQGLVTAPEVLGYDFTSLAIWAGDMPFTAQGTTAICAPPGCGLDVVGTDLYWSGGRINFTTLPQANSYHSESVSYSGDTTTEAKEYLAPTDGTLIGVDPPINAPELELSGWWTSFILMAGIAAIILDRTRRLIKQKGS